MVHLTQPVGKNAFADFHNIAAVQAAFKHIRIKTRTGMKPLWPGRIDGRKSKDLEDAIMAFQASQNLAPSGKIESFGPGKAKLDRAVPAQLRALRGIPGTNVVAVPKIGEAEMVRRAEAIAKQAPLPEREAKALAETSKKVAKELGLPLALDRTDITNDGRFAVTLAFNDVAFLDPQTGKPIPRSQIPKTVIETVCNLFSAVPAWEKGTPTTLEFRSHFRSIALGEGKRLSQEDRKILNLKRQPETKTVERCAAACASLIKTGHIATPNGRTEFAMLVEAIKEPEPQTAKAISETASRNIRPIFSARRAEIQRLVDQMKTVDPRDTEQVRSLVVDFWTILDSLKDPIARLALEINDGEGFPAQFAADHLRHFLGDKYIEEIERPDPAKYEYVRVSQRSRTTRIPVPDAEWRERQAEWVEQKFREVQLAVAVKHWEFMLNDEAGVQGILSRNQTVKYHHEVFDEIGLPRNAFGGTPFSEGGPGAFFNLGAQFFWWCLRCDDLP